MPRTARAAGKGPRTLKTAEAYRAKAAQFVFQMGPPLEEAIDFVQALELAAYSMDAAESDERAIITVARAASKRLETLQETRRGFLRAVGPQKAK